MDEILKTLQYLQAYLQAIETAADRFVQAVPMMVKQHIQLETKRKLDTTAQHYMDHVSVKTVDTVLVVELDKEDWLVNAVESGVGSFDMREGLLRSPKAKTSKAGHKFIHVPIGKSKHGKPGTEKGQEYQKRINEVLMKPKVGLSKLKATMGGKVIESQKILTDDPKLQGFYRTRIHPSVESYYSKKSRPTWNYVLFRTVSSNPKSKTGATWQHSGIKPAHIMKSTSAWVEQSLPKLLESFIEAEIEAIKGRV